MLIDKVKAVALCTRKKNYRTDKHQPNSLPARTTNKVLAPGASTGGTEALASLSHLPANSPGTLIAAHASTFYHLICRTAQWPPHQ